MDLAGDNSEFFGEGTFEKPRIMFYFTEQCADLGIETQSTMQPEFGRGPVFQFRDGQFGCDHCEDKFTSGPDLVKHWQEEHISQSCKSGEADIVSFETKTGIDTETSDDPDESVHEKYLKTIDSIDEKGTSFNNFWGNDEAINLVPTEEDEISIEMKENDQEVELKLEKEDLYNSSGDEKHKETEIKHEQIVSVQKDKFNENGKLIKLNKGYICKICDLEYKKVDSMRMHMKRKHSLLCSSCPYKTSDLAALKQHANSEHAGILYPCRFCRKNMLSLEYLKKHEIDYHYEMLADDAEMQFCDQCDYKTYGKYPLKRHVKSVHSDIRLECPYCEYVGKSKQSMKQHKKTHDGVKRNKNNSSCDTCDYKCCGQAKLKAHMGSKHGALDAIFYCDKCEFSSPYNSSLYTHLKVKHESSTLKCEYCEHVSSTKQNLKNHIDNKHMGIKHNCDQCDYAATSLQSLAIHKNSVHLGIKHPCDQCGYKASSYSALHTHRKAIHANFRVLCQFCDFSASFKRSLNAHVKRFHATNNVNDFE